MTISGPKGPSSPNPLQRIGQAIDKEVQKVQADVQGKIFNGWVGKAVSKPPTSGPVANAIKDLNLSAFKPAGPPPVLKRPVVMITGLTMQAASYDPMAKSLMANPQNGKLAVYTATDGQFHSGGAGGPVMNPDQVKAAKIFQVQYTDVRGAPTEKAPQLEKAFNAIANATGQHDVDVVAHSAGCTDFRLYLDSRNGADQSNVHINKAVLIGPASHGTAMGNVGNAVGGPLGVKEAGTELALNSKMVDGLNAHWDRQNSQVKNGFTIVGISGAPTPGAGGISDGDGFMQVKSLGMPGAETVVLKGADPTPVAHLMEVGYSGVIDEVQKRLGH